MQPDITWTHPFLDAVVHFLPPKVDSALDVGCGRGIAGALCRLYRNPKRLVGLDVFRPYLESLEEVNIYSDLVHTDLAQASSLPFRRDTFDVGVALEVLEHLSKESGLKLVRNLQACCTRVIISTPNGYFDQEPYDANPYQHHISAWAPADLERLGFDVYGVGALRGFGRNVGYALGRLTAIFPRASTQLLAVHDRRGKVPTLVAPDLAPRELS